MYILSEGLLHHLCVLTTSIGAFRPLHLVDGLPARLSAPTFSTEATRAPDPLVAHASSIESPQLASLGHADDLPRSYVSRIQPNAAPAVTGPTTLRRLARAIND